MPLLLLGKDTTRLDPSHNTSPIARKTNLVGQTKPIDRREIQSYNNHVYKNSGKTQILFMNNLIINPQFVGFQQKHRKRRLHRIDLQEHRGEYCIEDQIERRSHLATSYGPVGLW